jgi:hypothetical protein
MSNLTNVKDKVLKLEKQQRLLWPQFDQELNGKLEGQTLITKFIIEIFKQSGLTEDLVFILTSKSIEQGTQLQMGGDSRADKKVSRPIVLNQKQFISLIKYLYDFEQKKPNDPIVQEGEYARFFKETTEMAKYKKWSESQLTAAFMDRKKTETQLEIVSKQENLRISKVHIFFWTILEQKWEYF